MKRLSKALFVLPTLFTLTSVFMGLLSVVSAAEGNFRLSALTILFAILFDCLDGRVARLTKTQSDFGIQIDSLADVVSFGIAPAALVYMALLRGRIAIGTVDAGLLVAFLFLAAGTIRLARYNVDAARKSGPVKQFTGLPIPAAAGCLAGLVSGLTKEGGSISAGVALVFLLTVSLLMVSTVKYRKKVNLRSTDSQVLVALLAGTMLVVALARPAYLAFSFFAFYIAVGLAEGTLRKVFHVARRHRVGQTTDTKLRRP